MWQRLVRERCLRALVAGVLVLATLPAAEARRHWPAPAPANTPADSPAVAGATIPLQALPPEGRAMYERILQGGPFRHDKDGAVFGNRERLLPAQPRGYYREYTVRTPGERDRGARRIVCGGLLAAAPERCYYSDDHYASFRPIVP